MLEVNGKSFAAAIAALKDVQALGLNNPEWLVKQDLDHWFSSLSDELTNLGCRQTLKKLKAVRFLVEQFPEFASAPPEVSARSFDKQMSEVWSRLQDELEDQRIYCIASRDAEFLEPVEAVFGESVSTQFNDQISDLEEAAKSLAFARGTACVFHLMRAMEASVKRVGDAIGAAIVGKNGDLEWGKILGNMKQKIEEMPHGETRDSWSEVLTLLYHVKQAWRNNTMHPKQTYTVEEATDVLSAVRAFMRKLAPLV